MPGRFWLNPFDNSAFPRPEQTLNHFFPDHFQGFWENRGFGPSIDLRETAEHIIIQADLPGINHEDLDITVTEGSVQLKGELKKEKNHEEKDYHFTERKYGGFYRTIQLPSPVIAEKAMANYNNGVLKLTIPKAEKTKGGFKPRIETGKH